MDRGAWKAAVHGIAEGWTRLSDFTFTFHFHALEKEMATHSSVLAWRILGMREPGGLLSLGSHRVRHDWSDLATVAAAVCTRNGYSFLLRGFFFFSLLNMLPCLYHSMIIRRANTLRLLTQSQAQRTCALNGRCPQPATLSRCVSSPIHDDAQEAPLCQCLVSCRSGSSSIMIASEQILSSQLLIVYQVVCICCLI